MKKMKIYDSHVHVGGPWITGTIKGLNSNFPTTEKELIKSGISGAILMTSDRRDNLKLINQIKRYRGRLNFWFFWWINPQDKNDFKKIYSQKEMVRGLKIHPSIPIPLRVTEKIYEKYFDFAKIHRIPVIIHCGQWREIASYKFALQIAKRHPKVNFILAHMGGVTANLRIEAAEELKKLKLENVYYDISGTAESWSFEKCVKKILSPRYYIFGSDYPSQYPKINIQMVESLKISAQSKNKIFSQNLIKIFKKNDFRI